MTKLFDDKRTSVHEKENIRTDLVLTDQSMASLEKPRPRVNGHARNGNVNGSSEFIEMNGYTDNSLPVKKGRSKKDKNQKAMSNPDTLLIENIVKEGLRNGPTDSQNSLNLHKDTMYDMDNILHSTENSFEMNNSGPHREMAIDVPDNFVGSVKVPPVYPPPPASYNSLPHKKHNSNCDAMKNTDSLQNIHKSSLQQPSNEQLDRLRHHQEELKKRREEEVRYKKEEDFLRTSLRGSKKLQALEKRVPPSGVDNSGFAENEVELEDGIILGKPDINDNRYMKTNIGIEELFSSLNHIRSRLNTAENKDNITFLRTLFHNSQFQQAVTIHNKVVEVTSQSPPPRALAHNSQDIVHDVFTLCGDTREPYVAELLTVLNKPNFKGLLHSHDVIAETQVDAITEDVPHEDVLDYPLLQYGEDTVKIIHIEKSNEPLGATVKNEGDSVIIGRIVKGGAAEKSGLLHEGDEIVEVNGFDMRGKNVDDVSEMLANMTGTITFMIIPITQEVIPPTISQSRQATIHLRAMFNYDPEDDIYIPCPELGISFMKGDILHVINQDDTHWWQAYREGEQEQQSLAGLIPSKVFQEQREAAMNVLTPDGKENKKKSKSCASCGHKNKKKGKKKKKSLYSGSGEETEEILTYEEVARYYPQPNRKRPIVLIGPASVGRQELRDMLISSDVDRFSIIVPHTSRPKKAEESNGKEYHFITRPMFEQDIQNNKFVEYGEFEKNYYGTTLDAIRRVVNQGRICILNLEPESLKILRSSDLKPYVISVYPGNLEKLRQIHIKLGKSRTTDEELKQIIEDAREMEEVYGHLFDYVLVNTDLTRAYEELLNEINRIEVESQWVPLEWVDNYM